MHPVVTFAARALGLGVAIALAAPALAQVDPRLTSRATGMPLPIVDCRRATGGTLTWPPEGRALTVFWSMYDGERLKAIARTVAAAHQHNPKLVVLSVNLDTPPLVPGYPKKVSEKGRSLGLPGPLCLDPTRETRDAVQLRTTPAVVATDEGRLAGAWDMRDAQDGEAIRRWARSRNPH